MGLPLALNFALVTHVLLAGLFTFLWARNRGLSFQGSLLSGVIFMWGGAFYLHLYAGHLPNLTVMAWAPLYFLALDKLSEESGSSWFFWGVLALSMQVLGGHPQYVYFTSILGVFYIAFSWRGKVVRTLGRFVSIYIGAGLITAAQWGPGLEAYLESVRRIPMDPTSAKAFSFSPENILTLFLPDLFGNLHSCPYWGRWYLWEVSLFMGVAPFILAAISVVAGGKRAIKLAILAGIAFVFSLGAFTPLFPVLQWIPGFQGIRGMCKFDFLTALFLAMLAGQGLDILPSKKIDRVTLLRVVSILGIGIAAFSIILFDSLQSGWRGLWGGFFSRVPWLTQTLSSMDPIARGDYALHSGLQAAHSLFWGSGTMAAFCVLLVIRKVPALSSFGVPALAALELFLFARPNRPTFNIHDLQDRIGQVRALYQRDPGDYRVYGSVDAAMGMGGYDIWEDEPMVPLRYAQFLCRTQGIPADKFFSTSPFFTRFNKIYSLIRLKYLLGWGTHGLEAYRLPFEPLPRMILLSDWEKAEGGNTLDRLLDGGFDPRKKVLLERDPSLPPIAGKPEGNVQWKDLTSDSIEITADIPKPEILLVTDNFAKGWKAEAFPDSSCARYIVIPGDYFLRAVPLAAGHHHFRMVYRPLWFVAGKWVSILSCLLFGAMFLSWRLSSPVIE